MAESSVYSVRIPEEMKEKLNRLIEESERSPSDFFARMINTHEIESVGRAELDDARKLFARVEEIMNQDLCFTAVNGSPYHFVFGWTTFFDP